MSDFEISLRSIPVGTWPSDQGFRIDGALTSAKVAVEEAATCLVLFESSLELYGVVADRVPRISRSTIKIVTARSFVLALWRARSCLRRIGLVETTLQPLVSQAVAAVDGALPGLKSLRDSTAHADERAVGVARGAKIEPTGLVMPGILTTDGTMFNDGIVNNTYMSTGADGSTAQIGVTAESVRAVQRPVQGVVDSLTSI